MRTISTSVSPMTVNNPLRMGELRITVRALRAQNEGAEVQVQLLIENGTDCEQRSLLLSVEQYMRLSPRRGEITQEAFEELEAADELCRAIHSGEGILSFGANSVGMLTQKLSARGFSRKVATMAAEALHARGLIDEERDAVRDAERALSKLWGKKRIRAHLWSRGYGEDAIRAAEEMLVSVAFEETCARLIQKHYGEVPKDRDEYRRMMAFLSRYGYSVTEIRAAVGRLLEGR